MKNLIFSALTLLLLTGMTRPAGHVYQVISQHPHDLQELAPYVETISEEGRLWLVRTKGDVPANVMRHLRLVGSEKIGSRLIDSEKRAPSQIVAKTIDEVEVENLKADVASLSAYKTRAVGTEDNKRAVKWVQERLAGLGYRTQQICYRAGACSVVADQRGSGQAGVLLVIAHIDSVGKDFAGADDNASGTASLLEMARVLGGQSLRHDLRFFVTNGEESGLLGAKHYAQLLAASGEIRQLKLAINMDMVGYNSNGIVELETNAPYEALANEVAQLVHSHTSLKPKITLGAWGSDHVPFLEKNVPTLLTIEDWSTKTPCYHASCDKPDTLNYEYAGEITKLNVATILTKDLD
jgi:hypothetical protein